MLFQLRNWTMIAEEDIGRSLYYLSHTIPKYLWWRKLTKNDRPVNVINKMVSEMVTVQDQARKEGGATGVLAPPLPHGP